ncbi:MAG TPA: hypothetical protein VF752_15795 [Thermoleophilaceae bacterium]
MLSACLLFTALVAIWGSPTPRLLKELFEQSRVEGDQPAEPVL